MGTKIATGIPTPRVDRFRNYWSKHPLKVLFQLKEKEPIIGIHEINETRKGVNSLFKTETIPEINRLTLYNEGKEIPFKIGNCAKQRSVYPYRIRAKNKTRRIKKRESPPLTLNNLRFNPKFVYKISLKCPLCNNHQTMRIRNHNLKRETPICKEHKQDMYIKKVTKKRTPKTDNISIPKIIYQVNHS